MKQIRGRLTYANVMSTIAVFLVLGGATAIAGPIAEISLNRQEKRETRKIAGKIARKLAVRISNAQITKRAAALSVANAQNAVVLPKW